MQINKAINFLKERNIDDAEIAIVLGSGLGDFANSLDDKKEIFYKDIPGFTSSTVIGHSSKLVYGKVEGKKVLVMSGRTHYYEGLGIEKAVYPIKVLAGLGIKKLILTNAAGGINENFKPSDLMLIRDHINLTGINPLIGENEEGFDRFPDMTYTYSKDLRDKAKAAAKNIDLDVKEGVYMYFTGPSYETPAEIIAARRLGADCAGMSTVPEVVVARHRRMEVLGISCISNMAAGVLDQALRHEDVMEVSNQIKERFKEYLREIIRVIWWTFMTLLKKRKIKKY